MKKQSAAFAKSRHPTGLCFRCLVLGPHWLQAEESDRDRRVIEDRFGQSHSDWVMCGPNTSTVPSADRKRCSPMPLKSTARKRRMHEWLDLRKGAASDV